MEKLRELYAEYYHSVPTEKWLSKRRHRFKAKPLKDMTDIEMMSGINRDEAEIALEEYAKTIEYDESWGWFHQDEVYPELILLREWYK